MKKRILSLFLAALFVVTALPMAFAAGDPTITVASKTAAPGEEITLDVTISNNPGINTFSLGFTYDTTRLLLQGVTKAAALGGQFAYSKKAVWLNSEDSTYNGTILTLSFKVLDNAENGDASVAVTYSAGDIANYNEDDVNFALVSGKVTVQQAQVQTGSLIVSSATAAPNSDVILYVSTQNNPGINTFSLGFSYDTDKLQLKNVELSDNLNGQFTYSKKAVWLNSTDSNFNGEILILTFHVLETADEGDTSVAVTYSAGDIANYDEEDVDFTLVPGTVTIQNSAVVIPTDDPQIVVSNVKGNLGKTVDVTVSLQNNPGIIAAKFALSYDASKLTLTKATNGGVFEDSTFMAGKNLSAVPYTVYWEDALAEADYQADDILATFTFDVAEDADIGVTPITLQMDYGSTFNYDMNEVTFAVVNGSVEITDRTPGDPNGDGVIDLKDVVLIRRYLAGGWDLTVNEANADVNDDGILDLKDVVILKRYLAGGWNVTLK